ncbi:gamma subclass chorismate mutase AroQ [Halomonas sp. MCCC 1A17488]|uniref:gamma subclass chorismate mutase AroQ n=1 Tax=unclassified Halomonas TaxID=2609666 RepID=UPI0018D23B71|nr:MULTISPECIES: gamma subclass chorismate mutase AroQ [unclassified Halomonas]MCE8016570.1 gamma subclass chorismate mutase AroQ [Halomonas sp. MCCC 1A17488]MCG3239903.1 gamma subclass chorismate mutase AroQ [Halomonas sp. MCCC 1A17488]QPP50203.1 gamma subclass chorismate mutase AroQ [Halomonas sp. SS10-MC5]
MSLRKTLPIHPGRWLVVALALLLAGCQMQPPEPPDEDKAAIDRMLGLIDERLDVAPLVAQSKWNSGAPIEAPEREAQILDQVAEDAEAAGVEEDFARRFFEKQFEASKQIQRRLHHQWLQEGRSPFADPPDLAEEVRPVLDRLTPQLIESLADIERIAAVEGSGRYLERRATELIQDDFDGEPRDVSIQPLLERLSR